MLKKTVTYEDFDGNTVTEDLYFNLTKAELLEIESSEQGGFAESMQRIIAANNGKQILAGFKYIILKAYGIRDGSSFMKSDDIRARFEGSPAYSELFMELATDAQAGAAFVNAVVPRDLAAQVASAGQAELPLPPVETPPEVEQAVYDEAAKDLTDEQLRNMSQEDILAYFKTKGV